MRSIVIYDEVIRVFIYTNINRFVLTRTAWWYTNMNNSKQQM